MIQEIGVQPNNNKKKKQQQQQKRKKKDGLRDKIRSFLHGYFLKEKSIRYFETKDKAAAHFLDKMMQQKEWENYTQDEKEFIIEEMINCITKVPNNMFLIGGKIKYKFMIKLQGG